MSTPHWSHRLSQQNSKSKATSAGKRIPQTQAAALEAIIRNAKIGASTQASRLKKSSNISRPFTTGGPYKKAETTTTKSLLLKEGSGGGAQTFPFSRELLRESSADTKTKVRFLETYTRVDSSSNTNINKKLATPEKQ